jgi:hypothetical protein
MYYQVYLLMLYINLIYYWFIFEIIKFIIYIITNFDFGLCQSILFEIAFKLIHI